VLVILTGSEVVDQIFSVLLSTNIFVGIMTGFILDNTVPGNISAVRDRYPWKAVTSKVACICKILLSNYTLHCDALTRVADSRPSCIQQQQH